MRAFTVSLALLALSGSGIIADHGRAEAPLLDAQGYRSSRFRAPVDQPPSPASKLALAQALTMVPGRDALFVDVAMPENGLRDAQGQWHLAQAHISIRGALWIAGAGQTPPDPQGWARLQQALATRDPQLGKRPVVLFCHVDCWMGWNAARRLALSGISQVFWLEEGVEGWSASGGPTATLHPL